MSRRRDDTICEVKVNKKLLSYGIFVDQADNLIINIATNDQSTRDIADSLCNVAENGQKKLIQFASTTKWKSSAI